MSNDLPIRTDSHDSASVLWRRLDQPMMEYCDLSPLVHSGWRMLGHVTGVTDGSPAVVEYIASCDATWQTVTARVYMRIHGERRSLVMNRDADDRWWMSGSQELKELPALRGCVDVDFGFTPATNTLPIRRLNLALGESQEVTAAWVRFPTLDVTPLQQRYTRTGEHTYRYESLASGFTAELTVDDHGLVITYPGIWERVATA